MYGVPEPPSPADSQLNEMMVSTLGKQSEMVAMQLSNAANQQADQEVREAALAELRAKIQACEAAEGVAPPLLDSRVARVLPHRADHHVDAALRCDGRLVRGMLGGEAREGATRMWRSDEKVGEAERGGRECWLSAIGPLTEREVRERWCRGFGERRPPVAAPSS